MTRGAWIRWLIGLAVSAVFLWLAFRSVDAAELWREITNADQRFLIPATATTILTCVLSAQFIPARLGDLVRAYVVGQVSPVSKSKALGTLVVERLSDLFAVVIF